MQTVIFDPTARDGTLVSVHPSAFMRPPVQDELIRVTDGATYGRGMVATIDPDRIGLFVVMANE